MSSSGGATAGRGPKWRQLWETLREDWRSHEPQPLARPGFHTLALHRIGHALILVQDPAPLTIRAIRKAVLRLAFVARAVYGLELPESANVGRRVVLAHQGGTVIAPDAVIGEDCLIHHNVTIGAVRAGDPSPRIGRHVEIGAGAVIVGDIEIGDGAFIGPNCVVSTSIPAGARVVAAPPRVIGGSPAGASSNAADTAVADGLDPESVAVTIRDALDIDAPVGVDTPLLSSGLVDSINLVLAIQALETKYGVRVQTEGIDVDQFDTAAQIAAYLDANR